MGFFSSIFGGQQHKGYVSPINFSSFPEVSNISTVEIKTYNTYLDILNRYLDRYVVFHSKEYPQSNQRLSLFEVSILIQTTMHLFANPNKWTSAPATALYCSFQEDFMNDFINENKHIKNLIYKDFNNLFRSRFDLYSTITRSIFESTESHQFYFKQLNTLLNIRPLMTISNNDIAKVPIIIRDFSTEADFYRFLLLFLKSLSGDIIATK
jgi:hypothetical protein